MNGTTVYQTVTLDGYTQVPINMPTFVFHTPYVRNQLGPIGGMYTGPSKCPSCYISYSTSVSDQPGSLLEDDNSGAEVQCSVAGVIFTSFEFLQFEVAYTRSLNTGVLKGTTRCPDGETTCNLWLIASYCTPLTTPPDFDPSTYGAPNTLTATSVWFIDSLTACVRIKGTGIFGWVCLPTAATIGWPQSLLLLPANCTHTP